MKKEYSYDVIAERYDFLSRMVFFKSQVKAQANQLSWLKSCKQILIVGGGTGWILEAMNILPYKANIFYIEKAGKMIALAKQVQTKHQVHFIKADIACFEGDLQFDAVLTPFLFDNFEYEKAKTVFDKIDGLLKPSALWLFSDFYLKRQPRLWQRVLLKTMQYFFKKIGAVDVSQMVSIQPFFLRKGYRLQSQQFYYGGFIMAQVWQGR